MDAIKKWGAPQRLRTDLGTENGLMAAIQCEIHQAAEAHLYGASTANQRIEALWSHFKAAILGWISFFRALCEMGEYHQGHENETAALRFCFMTLIQQSLDQFKGYWNMHNISPTSSAPGGVPDVLFYSNALECVQPTAASIANAEEQCESPSITGSTDLDEYLQYVMQHQGLQFPSNKDEGIQLYEKLIGFLNQ